MLTIIALVIALLFLSWPWNVVLVIGAALVDIAETGGFVWWSRRRRRLQPAIGGAEALVGRTGVALARLGSLRADSVGQIRVDGEIWNARSAEQIDPGETVVVSAVDGLTLEVEPAPHP